MKKSKLIVFDMDGVLIDVSGSYRETVRRTAALFFKIAPASGELPQPLFSLADLAAVKQTGGLNNDWDLSSLVISLLFTRIEKPVLDESQDLWIRYRETVSRCDVRALGNFLTSTTSPLSALLQKAGKTRNTFVDSLYRGDVGSGNIIKQIFQEVYLGKDLFEATYSLKPKFYLDEGLIHREQLLIDKRMLAELAADHVLAIATGRPRAEADYPLQHFGIGTYFTKVMALDDCLAQELRVFHTEGKQVSLSKPHPYMLDAVAAGMKDPIAECYYIGDMPDDMEAARRSAGGYKGIGALVSAPDRKSLKADLLRAGADAIIEDFKQLKTLLESGNL